MDGAGVLLSPPLNPRCENTLLLGDDRLSHECVVTHRSAYQEEDYYDSFGESNRYGIVSPEWQSLPCLTRSSFSSPVPEDSILYNDYRKHHPDASSGHLALVPHAASQPSQCISLYIQMEYCSDGSLRDVLNEDVTPLSIRLDFFRQVGAVETPHT